MRRFIQLCLTAVCALVLNTAQAQTRTVTGRITSAEDGSALPGVNIVVKGTANGTVTDVNGNYTIQVPQGSTIIVYSFIGLLSQEIDVSARSVVDVPMEQDVKQLQEVVVNAIGVETPKDKLGTAPATVRGDALVKSGETGVINSLAGKAPGLTITRNGGDPGAGSYIQIRGQSTITGDLQPLIVIDGMPMYNSYSDNGNQTDGVQQQSRLNDLNPDDIANVEVLKSASSAALWGSRAANGVIMITTKKGKAGRLRVGYAGTLSLDEVNKTPDLQTTFGQGSGGKYAWNSSTSWGDKIANRPGTPNDYITDPANAAYTGYTQLANGEKLYRMANGTNDDPGGGNNSTKTYNHGKDVFRTGSYWEHALNLSGGNDKSNFYVSYSNLDQKGIVLMNSDYKRNTARVNASTMLTDKFHASTSVTYSNIRSNRVQQGSNVGGIYLGGLRTPGDYDNSNYIGDYYDADGVVTRNRQISYRDGNGSTENPGYDNPFWTIRNNKSLSVVNRVIGNVELTYDLTDWLNLRANAGVDTYSDRRADFINAHSAIAQGGQYEEQTISESQWNSNLFATAKKKLSDAFSGGVIVGFNYNSRQYNNVGAQVQNFIIPDAPASLDNSDPANRLPYNYASTVKTSAGFTELTGELYDQVFVTLTGRAESASTFGPLAKSLFFYPSASAAWQFTKFTGSNNILNFGKLRASFGVVGRQPDPYINLTKYSSASMAESWGAILYGPAYGGGYARSVTAGNPYIKPERKHEFETGFDLRFLNDRISLSATAFYSKTTDVILPVSVAPSSGYAGQYKNAGTLQNKGLEFDLQPTWVKTASGFTWSSGFIWSLYRNKVLNLSGVESVFLSGGGFSDGSSRAVVGQPIGVIWGTYYAKNADGSYVLDENGYPKLNANEGVIGNPNPKYRMSISNTFSYKGFTLYALFDFQHGGDMWNGTRGALVQYGTAAETAKETTVSATDAGNIRTYDGKTIATSGRATQNTDGSYTFRGTLGNYGGGQVALDQAWYQGGGSGFTVNQPFIENASWARLREVTLSYTIGSAAFRQATKLSSVTFSVTGRNVALWTNYKGIDPETNLTGANNGRGIDYFQNPNTRSLLFKLAINY